MSLPRPFTRLVGRDRMLSRLGSALAEGQGALIVGPPGIGKTALAAALADRVPGYRVEALYGTEVSRRSPYGALAPLLSELPFTGGMNPVRVLQEVRRLLRSTSAAAPPLLVVDDADQLDELSVQVISQLVRAGDTLVVATATDLLQADPEVLSLWADGHLQRIDVEALAPEETRTLMERQLGGRVSEPAARDMWKETQGNPHFTILMTEEQVQRRRLVRSDAVWVRARPYVHTGAVAEVISTRLSKLPADHHKVVEVLSRVSPLPLPLLLKLAAPETVDALEEDGTVVPVRGAVPAVRLGNPLVAAVVAANIPLGRSHQLWKEVSGLVEKPDALEPEALAGYVSWTLACEAEPEESHVLRAARFANDAGNPAEALDFVRSVGPRSRGQELVCEEVRALMALGDHQGAYKVLTHFESLLDPALQGSWTTLMTQKAVLLRSLGKPDAPQQVLDMLRAAPDQSLPGAETAALIDFAEAELLLAEGNHLAAVKPLRELAARSGISIRLRAVSTAAAAEALAVTGQAAEALALLDASWELLHAPLPAPDQSFIVTRLFYALYAAGELDRALCFVRENTDGVHESYRGTAGELACGIIHAAAGEADTAVASLAPAVSQLRFRDREDLLPLATALLAYAHGLAGNDEKASHYLALAPRFRHRPSWHAERVTVFHQTLSRLGRSAETAARSLIRMAEDAEARGNISFALACFEAAASSGDHAAAAELARLAPTATGRWAGTLEAYGRGLAASDPQLLLSAAEGAAELGHHLLAYRAAGLVRTGAPEAGSSLLRRATVVGNAAYRKLLRENSIENALQTLSDFDARLVQLAAGSWSRTQIAHDLHLSPRTVDWHLNKLFRKLHVSGRTELRDVLRSAG
ncbi:MAG: LuxR family transcriptional regulator [Arthrobacter sp.]